MINGSSSSDFMEIAFNDQLVFIQNFEIRHTNASDCNAAMLTWSHTEFCWKTTTFLPSVVLLLP